MSYDILELKERLSRLKQQQVQKVDKLEIFPNGLTHSFGPKMTIFPSFVFLGNIGQENVFLQYSRTKKRLSRPLKQEIQKVEKWTFF